MGNSSDPVTLHKYLYANADPANGIDPSGNTTMFEQMSLISTNQVLVAVAVAGAYKIGASAFDSFFNGEDVSNSPMVYRLKVPEGFKINQS